MTTPLSGQQLTEIRTEVDRLREAQRAYIFDTAELKRENDRLRAELERQDGEARFWHFEYRAAMDNYNGALLYTGEMHAERDRYRAQVQAAAQARCWTNEDGRGFLFADDVRAALATTAPACTCAAEPVHQAGCETTRPVNPHADHDGNPYADAMWHEQHDDTA